MENLVILSLKNLDLVIGKSKDVKMFGFKNRLFQKRIALRWLGYICEFFSTIFFNMWFGCALHLNIVIQMPIEQPLYVTVIYNIWLFGLPVTKSVLGVRFWKTCTEFPKHTKPLTMLACNT